MQWIQDPTQSNAENLNNVNVKLADIAGSKRKEYLKAKIEEIEINMKIKNITDFFRGISEFKKGYQPKNNVVKHEKGDLVTDFHGVLAS